MSDIEPSLMAYADGELDSISASRVENLLENSSEARREVEMYRETSALLRAAFAEHLFADAREDLVPLVAPSSRRRIGRYGSVVGLALAACVVGFLGGSQWGRLGHSVPSGFAAEVAEYHAVLAREDKHLVEVPAAQATEIATWLGERLNRPIKIPNLSAEGLKFAGARMLVYDGRPVAQFMYTRPDGRPIGFCITSSEGARSPLEVDEHDAERTAVWADGRFAYVVVGETGETALRNIAASAARQVDG